MKSTVRLLLIVVLVGMSSGLYAQLSGIDRYFSEYKQDERFTHVSVSSKMFSLFVNFEMDDPAEKEIVETISRLKGLKILVGNAIPEAKDIHLAAIGKTSNDMEELMEISDPCKDVRFFITEANGRISELLMVGYEGDKVIMLSLVGDIDLKEISALSKKMNIGGLEHLKDIN